MGPIKKILIFGGNGLVGKSFIKLFQVNKNTHIVTTSRSPKGSQIKCDIFNTESIRSCIETVKPSVIINCTNLAGGVNFCEENSNLSEQFHFLANKTIGEEAIKLDIPFVLISTDYVFDGTESPYKEEDGKNPLNIYGIHKLQAENWIKKNAVKYVIARTTNVFGWDPLTKTPNFLMQLFFNLSEGKTCNAPSFLSGNPTHVDDLTMAISSLISNEKYGVYHVVGNGHIDRFSWAQKFCSLLNLDASLLIDIKKAPLGIVPRPFNSSLNTDKLEKTLGYKLSNIEEGLLKFKNEMISAS